MMPNNKNLFNLEMSNIPLINLRNEFNSFYAELCSKDFRRQFAGPLKPIESQYLTWYGMPPDFLTLILQRGILGVESYLTASVFAEAALKGILTKENLSVFKNPFKLGGRSTADNYYNRLPAIVDRKISLKKCNQELWKTTVRFYSEIRNPLFHGSELNDSNVEGVLCAYQFLADIYDWIDSWHSPENLIKGGSILSNIKKKIKPS